MTEYSRILFVDACVRTESRTRRLADCLIRRLSACGAGGQGKEVTHVRLAETAFPVADETFINHRYDLIDRGAFDDPIFAMAKDFAAAKTIVIAAPYWDLSFPSMLKQYLEQICVLGVTFIYENDLPKSLCRAKRLYYVTTAGGPILSDEPGYGYVRSLAQAFFGIPEIKQIKAQGLDLAGADPEGILQEALKQIEEMEL